MKLCVVSQGQVFDAVEDIEEYDLEGYVFAWADIKEGIKAAIKQAREEWDYDPSDSYLLRDSESVGGGGARDSSASYRSEMRDAGRGALLR